MMTPFCRTFISIDCVGFSPRTAIPFDGKPLPSVSATVIPGTRPRTWRATFCAVFAPTLSTSSTSVRLPVRSIAPKRSGRNVTVRGATAAVTRTVSRRGTATALSV